MNLLPRRSVLAIAAVVDVGLHSRSAPVAAKALAWRHNLPPRHLETLLQGRVQLFFRFLTMHRKPTPDSDLDDDDLASAVAPEYDDDWAPGGHSVNPDLFTRGRNGVNGFSVVPSWVTVEMARVRAHHAAFLVTVILQLMRVRRTDIVPITLAVWERAGSPGERERGTILQHLRRVPGVLKLEERHKRLTRYQVTLGDMWDNR
jgi:hypothetical protein